MKGLPYSQTDERLMPKEIRSYGLSHKGYVRAHNEDAWMHLPNEHFYALADGMGGRHGGAIAAEQAIKVLCEGVKNEPIFHDPHPSLKSLNAALIHLIQNANEHVWNMGQKDLSLEGMGTTLCCLCILKNACIVANIGDSRIYRFREGTLDQLTHDDSLIADLMKFDLVDDSEAKKFPLKHIITKSIGSMAEVEPALEIVDCQSGDLYMLCSDGLTNYVSHALIKSIIANRDSIQDAAEKLIQAALDAGGFDNITVVLVHCQSE